eukprot:snap_masked-scaffold_33-processed-gene-1.23-mRNA-1 protein AED:1.00 eAED:1.00 QI:0/-1/0/0/-1/1/1/0/61
MGFFFEVIRGLKKFSLTLTFVLIGDRSPVMAKTVSKLEAAHVRFILHFATTLGPSSKDLLG